MTTKNTASQRESLGLGTALLAFLLILVLTLAPAPADTQAAANVQPALLALAAEQPDAQARVIIQKSDNAVNLEGRITQMGGTVINDLHIINAIVAEMEVETAVDLAYDANVNWVSLDGAVENAGKPPKNPPPVSLPGTYFLDTLNVRPVWDMGYQGEGVTVAVIDSGIYMDNDFSTVPGKPFTRVVRSMNFSDAQSTADTFGHGTHVAGIIGGHGGDSGGVYSGIAPKVNLISLRISDDTGMAYESDAVEAMQWALDNKDQYNIRVVNMSLNSLTPSSYHDSPMSAAAEILWFNGVVVVVSAGNSGGNEMYDTINSAPANDPFLITVGAMDEKGTSRRNDDSVPTFSAWGLTYDGHMKPEIYAPGKDIISVSSISSDWNLDHPERTILDHQYFRISGTSMSAPMVSGAAALLLQAEPNLTPDQVKYRLVQSAGWTSGWKYLDVYAMITTPTTGSSNTGLQASQLLWTGDEPVAWDSVNWGSVNWGSVNWGSVNWGSVNWGSVNWGSVSWDD